MFVMGNVIQAIAMVLDSVLTIYFWIVLIRVLSSWLNPDPYNPIVKFLHRATDPVLNRVRRFLPPMGGMDFSPILVLFAIQFVKIAVVGSLFDYARIMG